MQASLALETGQIFSGQLFGAPVAAGGEIVFHTGMTGYQEILTDPSYAGQIVLFTASHIGNYGIHRGEDESRRIHPAAVVVRDHCRRSFHQQAERSLDDVLRVAGVPGIQGIDTRAITRILRSQGSCRCIIAPGGGEGLVEKARALPTMQEVEWVREVSCQSPWEMAARDGSRRPLRVAVLDFGVKSSILIQLASRGCELKIWPANSNAAAILAEKPEGIFLSNGPGDPALLDGQVALVKTLMDSDLPLFGICLGHQLLARALGASTCRLPFGHHGSNHPVLSLADRRVEVTAHNHNYAVVADSLNPAQVEITHRSLNDNTVEGMQLVGRPIYSVQYHPEAAPGPTDAHHLFERFIREMNGRRNQATQLQGRA